MAFPSSPSNGQYYIDTQNQLWKYNTSDNAWSNVNDIKAEIISLTEFDLKYNNVLSNIEKGFTGGTKTSDMSGINYEIPEGFYQEYVAKGAGADSYVIPLLEAVPYSSGIPSDGTMLVYYEDTLLAKYYKDSNKSPGFGIVPTQDAEISGTGGINLEVDKTVVSDLDTVKIFRATSNTLKEDTGIVVHAEFQNQADTGEYDIISISSFNSLIPIEFALTYNVDDDKINLYSTDDGDRGVAVDSISSVGGASGSIKCTLYVSYSDPSYYYYAIVNGTTVDNSGSAWNITPSTGEQTWLGYIKGFDNSVDVLVENYGFMYGTTEGIQDLYYLYNDSIYNEITINDNVYEITSLDRTGNTEITINHLLSESTEDVWSTEADMIVGRNALAGSGIINAALSFGGTTGSVSDATEHYNGVSWFLNSTTTLTNRQKLAGCGTQNATLSFGGNAGSVSNVCESFNGLVWSSETAITTARDTLAGGGIQNAAINFGGATSGPTISGLCQIFNGSTWTTKGTITARMSLGGTGIQNASISIGGYISAVSAVVQKFNGDAWATTSSITEAKQYMASAGIQNSTIIGGGDTSGGGTEIDTTERFNGSIWTQTITMPTLKWKATATGTQNAMLGFGGDLNGTYLTVTEKFIGKKKYRVKADINGESFSLESENPTMYFVAEAPFTISFNFDETGFTFEETNHLKELGRFETTNGYWVEDAGLNTARNSIAGTGTQNSALSFGGYTGSASAVTEKFNGISWSSTGSLNTARYGLAGSGTQNSALSFGGYDTSYSAVTEKFNGSSWTATGDLNTDRRYLRGTGTQNSALSFGGYTGSVSAVTEKFNGTFWTATGSLNTARYTLAGAGIQNSALSFGGDTGSISAITEKFNGTSWTATGNLIVARSDLAGSGTQSCALSFGGAVVSYSIVSEKFNG